MAKLTYEELMAKVPEFLRPVVKRYGKTLVAWTAEEVWAWIERMISGDTAGAWQQLVDGLDDTEAAWKNVLLKVQAANEANAARMDTQKEAILMTLKGLLMVVSVMAGF